MVDKHICKFLLPSKIKIKTVWLTRLFQFVLQASFSMLKVFPQIRGCPFRRNRINIGSCIEFKTRMNRNPGEQTEVQVIFRRFGKLVKHIIKGRFSKNSSITFENGFQDIRQSKKKFVTAITKRTDMLSGEEPHFKWSH